MKIWPNSAYWRNEGAERIREQCDEYGFDLTPGTYNTGETVMFECAWCGGGIGPGGHKPDCKALSRNYRSSLGTRREMTERLRAEMDRTVETAIYRGAELKPEKAAPPKDDRTDLQKRFDAIAEELEENK